MMSPACFEAVDPPMASSLSPPLYRLLREESGFDGLAMTCDLDHRATIQDRSLADTAVAALTAGADLLLLSAVGARDIPDVAAAIAAAVAEGQLPENRVVEAANRVRNVAGAISAANVG